MLTPFNSYAILCPFLNDLWTILTSIMDIIKTSILLRFSIRTMNISVRNKVCAVFIALETDGITQFHASYKADFLPTRVECHICGTLV